MSSSDAPDSPNGFARAFAATFAVIAVGFGLALAVVDPLGAGPGNALCAAGAKTSAASDMKFVVPGHFQPRVAVIGTSRVHYGFDREALDALGGMATANLGMDGAASQVIAVLGDEVAALPGQRTLLVGMDFNIVHQQGEPEVPPPSARASAGWLGRLRAGWINPWAANALRHALPDCQVRIMPDGAPVREADGRALGFGRRQTDTAYLRQRLLELASHSPTSQPGADRLPQLRRAVARWRAQGHQVILFSAPYRPELLALYRETGTLPAYNAFHAQVEEIARSQGVGYVDFRSPAAIAALDLPPCPQGGIGCHYFDMTHYKPLVAQAMATRLHAAIVQPPHG